ncbi:MAG: hypothetical protein GQF41_0181 [Candidatus Rifleibacterium amylolyticum]|nr:MAG: hypothetical protein GQF41_0181 [Candidatus Rifleibacterium amylolyticum]
MNDNVLKKSRPIRKIIERRHHQKHANDNPFYIKTMIIIL